MCDFSARNVGPNVYTEPIALWQGMESNVEYDYNQEQISILVDSLEVSFIHSCYTVSSKPHYEGKRPLVTVSQICDKT